MNTLNDQPTYAGFGPRMAAYFIDSVILSFALLQTYYFTHNLADFYFQANPGLFKAMYPDMEPYETYKVTSAMAFKLTLFLSFFIQWSYFAGFESSPWQASPGKKLLGIYVTSTDGNRIGFGTASGRHFGKIISQFVFCIGYIVIGTSAQRQGWHDMMARCFVLRK